MSWRPVAVAVGASVLFAGCGGDGSADEQEPESANGVPIAITNFVYEPQELQIAPGTKVTWANKDSATHNVQDLSDLKIPISPDLLQGYKFSITYDKPGTYPYNCSLHPYMTGTVKVG
jgi:plastocyanin